MNLKNCRFSLKKLHVFVILFKWKLSAFTNKIKFSPEDESMYQSDYHNKRKILLKFVTSYSIMLIFVLTMGLFLYQYGIKVAKKSLVKQNVTTLENSVQNMDFIVKQLTTLTTQLTTNSTILSLINIDSITDENFYTYSSEVMNYMKHFSPLETLLPLNEYFIYLPKVNYLLSTSMLTDARLYYEYSKSFNPDYYNLWLDILAAKDSANKLSSLKFFSTSKENYTYLYRIPLSNYSLFKTYQGSLCVEFYRSDLFNLFSAVDLFDTGTLIIADNENNESFRVTTKNSYDIDFNELLEIIERSSSDDDIIETTYNKESVIITSITSTVNGWTYYLVQPSNMAFQRIVTFQNVYFIIIFATLVFCFLFIYWLSKRNVKPIMQINTQLQHSINERNTLQQVLEEQRPLVLNSYLARIMKGLISSPEELREIEQMLLIDTTNYKYTVLYACVYLNQLEFYKEDPSHSKHAISEVASYEEVLRNFFIKYFGADIYIYNKEVNAFALIIPCPIFETLEDSIERIRGLFLNLHDELMESHSLWIFGGLGNRNSDISYLWKSYQQSFQAATFVREGHVFQCFHELKKDRSTYYFPFEMAQQLSNFITTGNKKQVREIFKLIQRENFEDRKISITLIKWLLSDIRNTLAKVRFGIVMTEGNREILEEVDIAFESHKTLELMEEVSLKLCSLYEQKPEGNKLIATIQTYINANYKDPSLSLKKISEEFDISESYFSYLFKAETKQNFSEYLEQLRMEQAMLLIKTTDINLSDLYLEVGYNNANSFRRAFKKVHGVAPKLIRETMNL